MSYYDNQESVANIYVGLVERGWKCYGYKADESDGMTDYWSPARWDGIAEKNGFVLLVDVYGTHDSGRKITKKGFTPDWTKIEKLQATINDKAASQNEKEVSQKIIDNMMTKEHESTIVVAEFPTFTQGNPKGCNWHIEKDGHIIAKGKGAFQCDGYLFGGYEKETMKKVNAFIDRVEAHIFNGEQLQAVQKKVVKKVIKPVEVTDRKTLKVGDILSFEYHGHYWEVYNLTEKTFSYELLGSEKRGYQKRKNPKRYYDYLTKFEKNLEAGHVKIYELKEVEEVTYKTEYKKVKRTGQEENLLQGETVEEVKEAPKTENNNVKSEINDNKKVVSTVTYETGTGTKGNGIEITFTEKPSEDVRSEMKANGYRWGGKNRPSIWWAILTDDSLSLAKKLAGEAQQENDITELEADHGEIAENEDSSELENTFIYNEPIIEFDLQMFAQAPTSEDILSAFDDIDLTSGNRNIITDDDRKYCEDLERQYNDFNFIYEGILSQLQHDKETNKYIEEYRDIKPIKERMEQAKNSFLNDVLNHFKNKYSVKIDYWALEKKYSNKPITLDTIIDEVILILDGLTFTELETQQTTEAMKETVNHKDITVKNDKISIPSYFWGTFDSIFKNYKIGYGQHDKVSTLFKSFAHFENVEYKQFDELEKTIKHKYDDEVFTVHELNLEKFKSMKIYKNGKLDLVFNNSQQAREFFNKYLQN